MPDRHIDIRGLTKRFGPIVAVDDVSFTVDRGEVLGFLGPNGAGKSTTMKMICGFLIPSAGTALVCCHDVVDAPIAAKRAIGYLPEGAPAYPDMTARSFLDFIADIRALSGRHRRQRLEAVVEQVQIGDILEQPIDTLSKGFKRRVGLAQALLHDPQVLILDEPTDGLDPNQKHEVRALIRAMAPDKAIVISTHILEEVRAVCSRAVIIAVGRVVADGTPDQLEARAPTHNAVILRLPPQVAAAARGELATLPAVARVALDEDSERGQAVLTVFPEDGRSIVAAVAGRARERGWAVDEVYVVPPRLDDVFRSITTRPQA